MNSGLVIKNHWESVDLFDTLQSIENMTDISLVG